MVNNKILNVLISTIDNRVLGLKKIINSQPNIIFTVSHQLSEELSEESKKYIKGLLAQDNVIYSAIKGRGVAKNRNNCLKHRVKSSVCLLCDDDVVFFKRAFEQILNSFSDNPNADFITFKIKTFSGKDYKKYRNTEFKHNFLSLTSIGIIDVAFREEVIDKFNLKFDDNFGPGAEFAIGEDFIFMNDANQRNANILYKPINIVQHEEVGTGATLANNIIIGRGGMFVRVYGRVISHFANIYFAIKNHKKYKERYSLKEYIYLLYLGRKIFLEKYFQLL